MIGIIIIGIIILGLAFKWTIDASVYIIEKINPKIDINRKNSIAEGILSLMLFIFLFKFIFADYSKPDTALDSLGYFLLFWIISVAIINLIRKFDK
jgi:hypothetical protein